MNAPLEVWLASIAVTISALAAAGTWLVNRRKAKVDETTAAAALVWKIAESTDARAAQAQADAEQARADARNARLAAEEALGRVRELEVANRALEAEARAWRTWCSQDPPCLVRTS